MPVAVVTESEREPVARHAASRRNRDDRGQRRGGAGGIRGRRDHLARSRRHSHPGTGTGRYTINAEEVAGLEFKQTTKPESRDESLIRVADEAREVQKSIRASCAVAAPLQQYRLACALADTRDWTLGIRQCRRARLGTADYGSYQLSLAPARD